MPTRLVGFALLFSAAAWAMSSSLRVELNGTVTDFDDRFVYIEARSERCRVHRGAVPDSVELKPGKPVSFELSLSDVEMLPATAPASTPAKPYAPPRKRTPAEQ